MSYLNRNIQGYIEKWLFKEKIIIIYGARQVGKTTLAKNILKKFGDEKDYYDCELLDIKQTLESNNPSLMKSLFGNSEFVILDEAQKVRDIGLSLKLFHDTYPDVQVIATGSSSFDLSNKVNEPLTGRALEFNLMPFSIAELQSNFNNADILSRMNNILRFGLYPEVLNKSDEEAELLIKNITSKYLYKDILEFEFLKKSELLINLLKLLSFQLGSEVSKNELANKLYTSRITIEKYLDLLEKVFVIYRLKPLSRNLRKEINRKEKIYFYDLGIRNALISRFNQIEYRDDIGALWENFCIMERIKLLNNSGQIKNYYFWRLQHRGEIDFIEEYNDSINAFEFKWKKEKLKIPAEFTEKYNVSSTKLIHRNNFFELLEI